MAGTIHGLASWILSPECKEPRLADSPTGQPPSRSSDTSGLSVVLRWGRFLALRKRNGGFVVGEGAPAVALGGQAMKEAANGGGLTYRTFLRSVEKDGGWCPTRPRLPAAIRGCRQALRWCRCACRKSNTHIQMMESAKKWRGHNATNGMYCSRHRRVLVD